MSRFSPVPYTHRLLSFINVNANRMRLRENTTHKYNRMEKTVKKMPAYRLLRSTFSGVQRTQKLNSEIATKFFFIQRNYTKILQNSSLYSNSGLIRISIEQKTLNILPSARLPRSRLSIEEFACATNDIILAKCIDSGRQIVFDHISIQKCGKFQYKMFNVTKDVRQFQ